MSASSTLEKINSHPKQWTWSDSFAVVQWVRWKFCINFQMASAYLTGSDEVRVVITPHILSNKRSQIWAYFNVTSTAWLKQEWNSMMDRYLRTCQHTQRKRLNFHLNQLFSTSHCYYLSLINQTNMTDTEANGRKLFLQHHNVLI